MKEVGWRLELKIMTRSRLSAFLFFFLLFIFPLESGLAKEPSIIDYTAYPVFISQNVKPNILILLDNSGSMNYAAYGTWPGDGGTIADSPFSGTTPFYGYFEPGNQYTYQNNRFERDANGLWNGNWLNWLSMRRVDVARKVLTGGLATSRTGGGNTTLSGDDHNLQSERYWKRWFDSSQSGVTLTPYNGDYCYGIRGGSIYVDNDEDPFTDYVAIYNIKVKKDSVDEPGDFKDGNISGILQRVEGKARFGLEFFNAGDGGNIQVSVKSGNITNIITGIENKKATTATPLAEALYEGVRYFQQVSPYYFSGDYVTNNLNDPYYWEDTHDFVPCGKSFILLITDGESTSDRNIPSDLQDYDGDGRDPGSYELDGSDYLDDVALYAHVNDLRSALAGIQDITLYTVSAFGLGSQLLKDAAKNGGFIDKNGNNRPDQDSEWDDDGDGIPDTYFEAPNGYDLEERLLRAITDILKRAASGTAVSVLATSGEAEGNMVQAYFRSSITSGVSEVKWVGYLQSLWIDSYGNLREDSDGDRTLNVSTDKVIDYFIDAGTGDAKVKRFSVSGTCPYPTPSGSYEVQDLSAIRTLWEAGSLLAQRNADDRRIFTY
ncbi:MAG: hypothetical protein ABIG67_10900, partial [Pseudomonadota bacterium]